MKKDVAERFVEVIKNLINCNYKSITEFAIDVGIARSTVSCWLTYKRKVSVDSIDQLADRLDITTDELLGRNSG